MADSIPAIDRCQGLGLGRFGPARPLSRPGRRGDVTRKRQVPRAPGLYGRDRDEWETWAWGPYEPWARPLILLSTARRAEAAAALRALPDSTAVSGGGRPDRQTVQTNECPCGVTGALALTSIGAGRLVGHLGPVWVCGRLARLEEGRHHAEQTLAQHREVADDTHSEAAASDRCSAVPPIHRPWKSQTDVTDEPSCSRATRGGVCPETDIPRPE
jgi:hypothetical protein